jgi:hypothetical protein
MCEKPQTKLENKKEVKKCFGLGSTNPSIEFEKGSTLTLMMDNGTNNLSKSSE